MLAITVKQRPWIGISDNVQVKEQGEFHRKMLENEFQSKMAKSEFDTLMEMKMKFMWLAIYIQMRDLGPRMTFKYQPLQGIHLMKRLKTTFSVSSQLISFPTAHHQKMHRGRCEILQRKDSKSHIRLSPFVIYERVADDRIRHMMRHQMTINIQYRNTSRHTDENKKDKMTSYFLDALASLGFKLEVTEWYFSEFFQASAFADLSELLDENQHP